MRARSRRISAAFSEYYWSGTLKNKNVRAVPVPSPTMVNCRYPAFLLSLRHRQHDWFTMTRKQRIADPGSNGHVRPAIIYARVSSKDQEREGFSMPAQLNLLRDYSLNNRLKIAQEFEDVETAKMAGRHGFGQMISFFKKNSACRVLIVEKTD